MNKKKLIYPIYINAHRQIVNIQASSMYQALQIAKMMEKKGQNEQKF